MISVIIISISFPLIVYIYIRQHKFGEAPNKERTILYATLSNYKNGQFQNYSHTPNLTEGYSIPKIMLDLWIHKNSRKKPIDIIPHIKTDLKNISLDKNILVWFGHSSYYIQIDGKRILVDPVFSGNASPVPGTNKSFKGSDNYTTDIFPFIDYLVITHDHYDHLDYNTIISLKSKVGKVICGLGVGSHFEKWNFSKEIIIEKNWHESFEVDNDFIFNVTPARHFSGRSLSRNNTLWVSYVLQTPSLKIFIGGDSGYDNHFKEIGNKFGPIDFAILENGQYNAAWKYHHSHPTETITAANDLKVKRMLPVHSGKFALANHAWDEPLELITELALKNNINIATPKIGEVVDLNDKNQSFEKWWRKIN